MIDHFMFALSCPYDIIIGQNLKFDSYSILNTEGDQTPNCNNTNCNSIIRNSAKFRSASHCRSKRFKKKHNCSCNWKYSSRSCRNYWRIFVMSKYSFMDLCRLSKGININLINLFYIKLMESFTTNSVTDWIKKMGITDSLSVNLGGLLGVLGDALIYKANEMCTNLVRQIAKANLVTGVPLGQNEMLPDALVQQKQFADALLTGIVAPDSKNLMDFFTNRLAELELRKRTNYCQRCGTIKHEKFSDCTRRCNKCMGNHETINCYINRVCRWCSKLKGHSTPCTKPFYGFRKSIICPICGLKGHFGIECSPIFIALSSLFISNRNFPRRRRRINRSFIVRRGRRTFVLRRWRKRN